jgi:hypothetical protein
MLLKWELLLTGLRSPVEALGALVSSARIRVSGKLLRRRRAGSGRRGFRGRRGSSGVCTAFVPHPARNLGIE